MESIAAEVIARRCDETGVDDPEARAETLWAVRRAVARTLTDEDAQERTLRQTAGCIARARAEEVFDRAYGLVRITRAGVYLDQHPEWRSLQAFFEAWIQAANPPGGGGHHHPNVWGRRRTAGMRAILSQYRPRKRWPMSIQEISAAIEEVQPHILEYDPDPPRDYNPNAPANNHETSTRYLIIDPILRSKEYQ